MTIMMKNNDHVNDINVIYHMDAINQNKWKFYQIDETWLMMLMT
jgi:hypothetical protein